MAVAEGKAALLAKLKGLAEERDYEAAHRVADEILIEWLRCIGDDDLVDAWLKVGRWYA